MLLSRLINIVEKDEVGVALWDENAPNEMSAMAGQKGANAVFLKQHVAMLLQNHFSHVQP